MAEKAKEHTNGEKEARPDGAGKEVSGVKIIIEADSKEIADLVLTLQGQQNQDEIAKNYAIDIFGNKYLNYEVGPWMFQWIALAFAGFEIGYIFIYWLFDEEINATTVSVLSAITIFWIAMHFLVS